MEIGKELAKALLGFQSESLDIKKSADNPFFKSKYAPLDEIIPAIREAMKKHGLAYIQVPQGSDEVETTIVHAESGQWISGTIKMTPKDASPQGHGSAITYARRYALVSMLGLNTEGDDDGNSSSATNRAVQRPVATQSAIPARQAVAPASPTSPVVATQTTEPKPGCITVPQARRLFAIAKAAGKTQDQMKAYLTSLGLATVTDMQRGIYEEAIKWAELKDEPIVDESPIDEPPY